MIFTVKSATVSHTNAISLIERTCFALPRGHDMLERQIIDNKFLCLVAVDNDDNVLGYCDLTAILDEGYIGNVAVSPNYRHNGIADTLIAELILQKKADLAFITLEVRASNKAAIALYRKHGFCLVGTQTNHYEQPREDALLMTLFFHNTEVKQ